MLQIVCLLPNQGSYELDVSTLLAPNITAGPAFAFGSVVSANTSAEMVKFDIFVEVETELEPKQE